MRYSNRYLPGKRALAVAATSAMALSLMPAAAFAGEAEACAAAPAGEDFTDVSPDGVFADEIDCISGYDIVTGYDNGEFRPTEQVKRGQAAAYIVGMIEAANGGDEMATGDTNPYTDVDETDTFYTDIMKVSEAGIMQGDGGEFSATADLTRGQMASIVYEALTYLGADLDTTDNNPDDDVTDGPFADAINALLNAGIVLGVSDNEYNPSGVVTRGQLASFVSGSIGELDDEGLWAPTRPPRTRRSR